MRYAKLFWLFPLIFWGLIAYGCAGMKTGIAKGQEALAIIDSFYNAVLEKKLIPNTIQAATIILQQADVIASQAATGKDTATMIAQARLLKAQAENL
jgi:hypothetical protein